MNPIKFSGYNVDVGRPEDWDDERDGPCRTLPIYKRGDNHVSVWQPTNEEREQIANGANVVLNCRGTQIPVSLEVRPIEGHIVMWPDQVRLWFVSAKDLNGNNRDLLVNATSAIEAGRMMMAHFAESAESMAEVILIHPVPMTSKPGPLLSPTEQRQRFKPADLL